MSPTPAQADCILQARWIAPVEGSAELLAHHALVIKEGRIADLLPADQVEGRWQAPEHHDLSSHLLIPGLVNAHTHSAMNLFRGLADDLPLAEWLEEHVWPAEGKWVSEEFVTDGARLAVAEMIRGGTTCFSDMYFYPDSIARAATEAGIRAAIFSPVLDFPTPMGQGPDDYLHVATRFIDDWRNHPLITPGFGPHSPYAVSDEPLARIRTLSDEMDVPVMIHLHETAGEVQPDANGERPLARLHRLGLLSPRLLAAHMVHLDEEEVRLTAQTGTHVAHCPESNLKLASGFCRVTTLREAGINVALGTDGAASNNDLDMIGEMRTAALLGKAVSGDAAALPAHEILAMATLNGARSLGLDQQTGSLVAGKNADIVAVDMAELEARPLYDPVAQLVYSCTRNQVSHVWVNGRCLMAGREMRTLNLERLLRVADNWQQQLAGFS